MSVFFVCYHHWGCFEMDVSTAALVTPKRPRTQVILDLFVKRSFDDR